jgi:uncharacterized membrane protein HdeD (DUF308 family)
MEKLSNILTGFGAVALLLGVLILANYFTGWRAVPIPPNLAAGIVLLVVGSAMAIAASVIDRKRGVKRRW